MPRRTDNYADAIDALSSLNILDGFKDGDSYSFKADGTFTRAQAAKIVAIVHNAATNGANQRPGRDLRSVQQCTEPVRGLQLQLGSALHQLLPHHRPG